MKAVIGITSIGIALLVAGWLTQPLPVEQVTSAPPTMWESIVRTIYKDGRIGYHQYLTEGTYDECLSKGQQEGTAHYDEASGVMVWCKQPSAYV